MAHKNRLRELRENTVINNKSKHEDKDIFVCIMRVIEYIHEKYPELVIVHKKQMLIREIVDYVKKSTGIDDFHFELDTTFIKPDGGILFIKIGDILYPILMSERKNQGTNDLRLLEGKEKQGKGNAVERLGKNVIGLRTLMMSYDIFPFICFGDGCDFEAGSSIRDRVVTINQFGKLNKIYVKKENRLERGSFFFRSEHWTIDEMFEVMKEIVDQSISYYKEKGII